MKSLTLVFGYAALAASGRAVMTQFEGTYHANMCDLLMSDWPTGR